MRDEIGTNNNVEDAMMKMISCTASNVSMKNNQIKRHWKLVNFDNKIIKSR